MGEERRPLLWKQSFPFSCGPAALGSVLSGLGWPTPRDRKREEVEIWRESTAVACPGAHPYGLALSARRRGFLANVFISGPRPWLWGHIRRGHATSERLEYTAIEQRLATQCRGHRVRTRWPGAPPPGRRAGLLLVTAREEPGAPPDPHWIGLLPASHGVWVVDPLRSGAYRSARSAAEWWRHSGFEGTRAWVSLRAPSALAHPGPTRSRPRSPRAPPHTPRHRVRSVGT